MTPGSGFRVSNFDFRFSSFDFRISNLEFRVSLKAMVQNTINLIQAHPFILAMIKILIVLLVLAGIVAYLVYMERKVLSFMQARLGPMRVGPWGLLQPVADGIKLLLKEDIIPAGADKFVFLLAPAISVTAAFTVFSVIPFAGNFYISDINIGLLFILAVSSLGIYGIILGGWSSNSHYPLLGAMRSAAQLVSYEVAAGMALVGVLLISNSLSMVEIVNRQQQMGVWNIFLQPVAFVIYLIAAVAETNRNPFDLPEAESELTAGFHTEYSGFRFALYFLAEYTNMVVVSCIAVTMFLGGWLRPFANLRALDFLRFTPVVACLGAAAFILWLGSQSLVPLERYFFIALAVTCVVLAGIVAVPAVLNAIQGIFWFGTKVLVFLYAFIWYRGTFPRYRYDQLMKVGWHWMIPIGLGNLIVTALVRYFVSPHLPSAPAAGVGGVSF
jgi:NADH-quinone oxidoreductase subunit H